MTDSPFDLEFRVFRMWRKDGDGTRYFQVLDKPHHHVFYNVTNALDGGWKCDCPASMNQAPWYPGEVQPLNPCNHMQDAYLFQLNRDHRANQLKAEVAGRREATAIQDQQDELERKMREPTLTRPKRRIRLED